MTLLTMRLECNSAQCDLSKPLISLANRQILPSGHKPILNHDPA
jgi:hypothetical protein